jgi:hypothetical protein
VARYRPPIESTYVVGVVAALAVAPAALADMPAPRAFADVPACFT